MSRATPGVLVITGGSSGLGRASALAFARRGWSVGLIARGAEPLADACAELRTLGVKVASAQADVVDGAALAAAADVLEAALGPADLWINCAGNGVYGRFDEVPDAEFRRVTEVTYHGVVNGVRTALARMRPRGRGVILNVCSATAFHGLPMMSSYAGAKAAVRAFTQAVTGELALERSPIRVCAVFPPAVNTPFFSHAVSHMGWPARPAWPVYQPEVVAEGVWRAYCSGRRETAISGTSVVFNLATRIAPGLIAWCMSRLGIDKQSSQAAEALELLEPTLFEPSRRPLGVRGPFGAGARRWSALVWLDGATLALGGRLSPSTGRAKDRPGARPATPPAGPALDPEPGGLDERAGVS